jgi:hypothetical protein
LIAGVLGLVLALVCSFVLKQRGVNGLILVIPVNLNAGDNVKRE